MNRKKVNPKKIPRTQFDCDRAFDNGVIVGVRNASAIFMTVLVDKFNGADWVQDVWKEITKLSEEVLEGRVSVSDLRDVLRKEYGVDV